MTDPMYIHWEDTVYCKILTKVEFSMSVFAFARDINLVLA